MFMIFYLTINSLGKGALFSVVLIFCACISTKKGYYVLFEAFCKLAVELGRWIKF